MFVKTVNTTFEMVQTWYWIYKDTDGSNLNSNANKYLGLAFRQISCFCYWFLLGSIVVRYDLVLRA